MFDLLEPNLVLVLLLELHWRWLLPLKEMSPGILLGELLSTCFGRINMEASELY